jgi:uncharacterized membrane protein
MEFKSNVRPGVRAILTMKSCMSGMTSRRSMLAGIGLGAGMMYLLDPHVGARRRSVIANKLLHIWKKSEHGASVAARDVVNRSRGMAARVRHLLHRRDPVPDSKLCARVRSAIGRCVSHPSAIEVDTRDGRVILSGPVLEREVDGLISCVRGVEGVRDVENRMEVFKKPDVPALQGGRSGSARSGRFLRENWTPTMRVMAGIAGMAGLAAGRSRRDWVGTSLTALGGGLLLRAMTNLPITRLLGIGAGRQAVSVQKTINIDAPVDLVFDFLSDFEDYPRFMHHVKQVRLHNNGQLHIVLAGPAGASISMDEQITAFIPDRLIAWRSLPGQMVAGAGVARFEPNAYGGTRVDIKMSYNPPAGAVGHALARLFRMDAKTLLDEELLRVKTAIETGRQPHDAALAQR